MRCKKLMVLCLFSAMMHHCDNPQLSDNDIDESLILAVEINNSIKDASSYHCTLSSGNLHYCPDRNGTAAHAICCDGEEPSYILISDDRHLNFTASSFTISLWLKPDENQMNGAGIITKGSAEKEQFSVDVDLDRYRFWVRDESEGLYIINTTTAPDGQWHNIKAVYDRSVDSIYLYQDDELIGERDAPHELLSTQEPISIGARSQTDGTYSYLYKGSLSEVSVYDKALR